MAIVNIRTTLILTGFCLGSLINATENQDCDCRGPTNYYKEVGCTPLFKNLEDCCPIRYDCSVINRLKSTQCLINGHTYEIGEGLKEEDMNTCDWCHCYANGSGITVFACAVPSCFKPHVPDSCHYVITNNCCGGRVICPKEDGNFTTCVVDGKTYSDGESFVPLAYPEKRCRCAEGYADETHESFCETPKHTWCDNVLFRQPEIRNYCAPIYQLGTSLKTDCNEDLRCPVSSDVVIKGTKQEGISESEDPDMMCKFGDLTLQVGDELNEKNSVKCVCEVPPILTCRSPSRDQFSGDW